MRYDLTQPRKFIQIKEVCRQTSLGKSSIYDKVKANEFPKPRQLTVGRVAWLQNEIDEWIASRAVVDLPALNASRTVA